MQSKGKLTTWNDDKGYGFITPIGSQKKTFVHISSFLSRQKRPTTGDILYYNITRDKKGKLCATNVTPNIATVKKDEGKLNILSLIFAIIFIVIIGWLFITGKITSSFMLLYLATSLSTFILYAIDKYQSSTNGQRISENTLNLIALFGGWPGGIVAQEFLRHKSKKKSFRSTFFIMVFLNIIGLLFLITDGKASSF